MKKKIKNDILLKNTVKKEVIKMKLSPPTKVVLWISIIAGVVGFVFSLGVVDGVSTVVGAIVQLCALAQLVLGCMLKGF